MNRKRFIQAAVGGLAGACLADGFSVAHAANAQQAESRNEVTKRFQKRREAALAFLATLNAPQKTQMYLPVVNDSVGPSGKGIRVATLTDSAQQKALAHLMRITEPLAPVLFASESDAYIASLPLVLYLTVTGSATVYGKKNQQQGGPVRLFDFGSGQAAPLPNASSDPANQAFVKTQIGREAALSGIFRNGAPGVWWTERLQSVATQIKRHPYPSHLPIPETAFLNSASADYSALPLDAQRWIREQARQFGALPDAPSFDWNAAVIHFSQTFAFNGVFTEERETFPTLKDYGSFDYQLA